MPLNELEQKLSRRDFLVTAVEITGGASLAVSSIATLNHGKNLDTHPANNAQMPPYTHNKPGFKDDAVGLVGTTGLISSGIIIAHSIGKIIRHFKSSEIEKKEPKNSVKTFNEFYQVVKNENPIKITGIARTGTIIEGDVRYKIFGSLFIAEFADRENLTQQEILYQVDPHRALRGNAVKSRVRIQTLITVADALKKLSLDQEDIQIILMEDGSVISTDQLSEVRQAAQVRCINPFFFKES